MKFKTKHWLMLAGWVIFLSVGLYFSWPDISFIESLGQFSGKPVYDQRMYLYGSDYMAYDELAHRADNEERILGLVPGEYFGVKMTHFLYPRKVEVTGDPRSLQERIGLGDYAWLWVYFPQTDYYWGEIKATDWAARYDWSFETVYAGLVEALGEPAVGSPAAFLQRLDENYGNVLFYLGESK